MTPLHEAAHAELQEPTLIIRLSDALEDNALPGSYHSNPVTTANPDEPPIPFGLYMDGLPYSRVDSVLGGVVNFSPHSFAEVGRGFQE